MWATVGTVGVWGVGERCALDLLQRRVEPVGDLCRKCFDAGGEDAESERIAWREFREAAVVVWLRGEGLGGLGCC